MLSDAVFGDADSFPHICSLLCRGGEAFCHQHNEGAGSTGLLQLQSAAGGQLQRLLNIQQAGEDKTEERERNNGRALNQLKAFYNSA